MSRVKNIIWAGIARIETLLRQDEGQDLIEYGLLAALIAVVAVAAVTNLGNTIHTVFWNHIVNNF